MHIYLPIAEMSVAVEAILALGIAVGFLSGVFGVGGGFLTTPLLIFMGIPATVAVGTQASQMVAAGTSGALGHWSRGNVDYKMGFVMLGGGVFGSVIGIMIFRFLQYLGQIDFAVSMLYMVLLGGIGTLMLMETLGSFFFKKKTFRSEFNSFRISPWMAALPYKMRFPHSRLFISALVPAGIGFCGGLLSAILGIGGGFMLVPAMIYILGMPGLLAAGTSLFQIIFITAFATLLHAVTNHNVDIMLAVLLIAGSVLGTKFGVMAGQYIRGIYARVSLALLIIAVSISLAFSLFMKPAELFSVVLW